MRHFWKAPQPLQKQAYSNVLKILPPKTENFQIKNSDIFHISAQNIDCGYNLCFWAEIRKIMYTPVNPSFTIWKWGLRGSKLCRYVFMMICFHGEKCSGDQVVRAPYFGSWSPGFRSAGGRIHLIAARGFIAQSLALSFFHHLDMT